MLKRPILIAGPTASGKSALAARLAQSGGAVINADSMQVYDLLQVLTARPGSEELSLAPHHLFGHVSPAAAYSVARWLDDVKPVLDELAARGARPVFAGGTGLYFKALLEGLSQVPPIEPEIRQSLRKAAQTDLARLYGELERADPESRCRIKPGDSQRIVRALEVVRSTGKPLSWWQAQDGGRGQLAAKDCIKVVLEPDRTGLRARIAARFSDMMKAGAIDEVRALLALDLPGDMSAMRAIGVREIAACLEGTLSVEAAIDKAVTATAQYAKRQSTWFRNQFGRDWLRFGDAQAAQAAISRLTKTE